MTRDEALPIAWKALRGIRGMGIGFRRGQEIGDYIVDFVHLKRRLIVEVGQPYDAIREAWLQSEGLVLWRVEPDMVTDKHWIGEIERLLRAQPDRPYAPRKGHTLAPAYTPPVLSTDPNAPFWKRKPLTEMTDAEWESLCDGCGKCCLIGLEDEDTGEIHLTDVACKLLDCGTCQCSDYANRKKFVPDCVKLTPQNVPELYWLPKTCGYRLVAKGEDLRWWHPLVSGDPNTVHEANVSVRGKVRNEKPRQSMKSLMMAITKWPDDERGEK